MSVDAPLPADLYTLPEAFQRERLSVFQSAWLLLARADALRKPGDYVAQALGGWPVFAIADASGAARAFRNVCRHQKLPIFDTGTGHCEQIRCRYHGWTYDTAGHFISAPPPVAPNGPLSRDLQPVAAEEFHGLLFVHLDDEPPALADTLPALASALSGVGLGTHAFRAETTTDIDANWKLVMEVALADPAANVRRWAAWPTVILDIAAEGAVLHQVIARSFHRSCIHHHHYGAPAAADQATAQVARWKANALARQAALEAGATLALPASPELEAFRGRLRAACAQNPVA
ncbi:MAG: aromatic ring-hydroxylating oxygenase subunit alpha [Stellaceae bacterium]